MDKYEKLLNLTCSNYDKENMSSFITKRNLAENELLDITTTNDIQYIAVIFSEVIHKELVMIKGFGSFNASENKVVFQYE